MADIIPQVTVWGTPVAGAGSPYNIVPAVINASWNLGLDKAADYDTKITALELEINTILATPGTTHVSAGTVTGASATDPGVSIPTSSGISGIFTDFKTQYTDVILTLDTEMASFRTTFFPNEATLYSAAEATLQAALASGNFISASVQQQIWGDDQARILSDKTRAQDAVMAQFAARGFPLPPDVAASAVVQIEQKAQDELAESSRKIAIMSVEQYRFVIDKVLSLRAAAMSATLDYVKAIASGPDIASRLVGIGYDAQQKLISAAASYFGARVEAAKVINQVAQYNNSTQLEADIKNQAADLALLNGKVDAMKEQARALAQMATSLLNNIHASAGVSGSTSDSVGYSYSNDTASAAPSKLSAS